MHPSALSVRLQPVTRAAADPTRRPDAPAPPSPNPARPRQPVGGAVQVAGRREVLWGAAASISIPAGAAAAKEESAAADEAPAKAPEAPTGADGPQPELYLYTDEATGFEMLLPEGWRAQIGLYTDGIPRLDFQPGFGEVTTRITIEVLPTGKLEGGTMAAFMEAKGEAGTDDEAWGIKQAGSVSGEGKMAAKATLLDHRSQESGRVYAFEWTLDSIFPARLWGVSGIGYGPNKTARKLNLKQLVKVSAQLPEDQAETPRGQMMKLCVDSFRFTD